MLVSLMCYLLGGGIDGSIVAGYTILVLPGSIVRVKMFLARPGQHTSSGLVIFVGLWYELAGLVEVFLFVWLKPDFGLKLR